MSRDILFQNDSESSYRLIVLVHACRHG
jgi:hypothetical protein